MRLQDEMYTIVRTEGNTTTIAFHPEHVIYKAHFPGKPITPGVCIIQIINELLELRMSKTLQLKEVKNLKFVNPISPVEEPSVDVLFEKTDAENGEVKAKGLILKGEKIFTKFSLRFQEA